MNYGWKEIEIAVDADGNTDSPWICTTHLTSGGIQINWMIMF